MAPGQINLWLVSVLKHLCNVIQTVLELSKVTAEFVKKIPETMFDFVFFPPKRLPWHHWDTQTNDKTFNEQPFNEIS